MGVYISGLEIPPKGKGVVVILCSSGAVYSGGQKVGTAVPVPPHGRVIDADEIKKRISHMNMEAYMDGACYGIHPSLEYLDLLNEILDDAPTVIEAEDGE